jgi:hypothetical protein
MKGAQVHQIYQSRSGLCLIVIFLMLLLPTRPTVAHSARSSGDPALAGTRGSDISENACGKEPAIGGANRSEFPVWKTITVGIYKNVSAMREALDAMRRLWFAVGAVLGGVVAWPMLHAALYASKSVDDAPTSIDEVITAAG